MSEIQKLTRISLARVSTTEFAVAFWPMVATLIPLTIHHHLQCEETFQLALALFKKLAETSLEFVSLENLVKQWATLLLAHRSNEVKTRCIVLLNRVNTS